MSRLIALVLVVLAPLAAWAHHGWSSFDETRPIYLAGSVQSVAWQNPHAELVVAPAADLALPPGLASRSVPAQEAPVDGAKVLAGTTLASDLSGTWTVELAPLTRMDAWGVARIAAGAQVELVGYTFPQGKSGERVMRVEFLFIDGKAYSIRSMPKR
jgi:hypothetical protein